MLQWHTAGALLAVLLGATAALSAAPAPGMAEALQAGAPGPSGMDTLQLPPVIANTPPCCTYNTGPLSSKPAHQATPSDRARTAAAARGGTRNQQVCEPFCVLGIVASSAPQLHLPRNLLLLCKGTAQQVCPLCGSSVCSSVCLHVSCPHLVLWKQRVPAGSKGACVAHPPILNHVASSVPLTGRLQVAIHLPPAWLL